jgi:hypothetical protein
MSEPKLHDDIFLLEIRKAMVEAIHAVALRHGLGSLENPVAADIAVQTCAEALLCVAQAANPEVSAMQIAWQEDTREFWVGVGSMTKLYRRLVMHSAFIENNTPFDA